jgi:TonB-linked SusC/RagA family outer membrane protein
MKNLRSYRLVAFGLSLFLFLGLTNKLNAQNITINGTVIDAASQEPLIGVNIVESGTSNGTITDYDGNYRISVPSAAVLIFSYTGFADQEIPVNGRNRIDISLATNASLLDEVVVTGYGSSKRSDVTGSIVTLKSDELKEVPVADIAQGLQGRLPGVVIQRTSSRPGAGSQIRIRGNRSLGSDESGVNDPLIVVDGLPFQGGLNDLNPDLIESINVLKDASATAIYGSRGANGVILITTKKGVPGKATISYNGYYGFSSALDKYPVFDAQGIQELKEWSAFYGGVGELSPDELEGIQVGRDINWQDEAYTNGHISNHELTLSGGTQATRFSVSGGYFSEATILEGQDYERYTLRASIDSELTKWLQVGISSINTVSIRGGESANPVGRLNTLSPLFRAYNDDGSIYLNPAVNTLDEPFVRNPLLIKETDKWNETRRRLRTFNTLYGEITIIDGLKYRLNVGLDYVQDEYNSYFGSDTPFRGGAASLARIRNRDDWGYTIENILKYDKSFGKHTIGLTGLFSFQEQESQRSGFEAQDVFSDFVGANNFFLAGGTNIPSNQFNYSRWGLISYMGRANYSFDNRFVLTATLRVDGSSRLARGNKYFTYPAFAAAWNISNESFMDNASFDNLKLRVGWGRTSNQAIAPYSSLGRLSRSLYQLGGNSVSGFAVTNLPNPNLSWEFTTSRNIGVDFGILDYRLTGSIDYYWTATDGVLQSRALPATSGVPNPIQENIGETKSNGIEIALSADIIRTKDKDGLDWGLDINFAAHKEEIVALGNGVEQNIGNGWFVGQPVNVIYDYEKIGIWQSNEADAAANFGDYKPGDIKVADLDGDGVQSGEDRKILGQLDPKWTMGLSSRFGYKNFDLSIVGFANVGNKLISTFYQGNTLLEGRRNAPIVDYWTNDNPTNSFPRPGDQDTRHHQTLGYFNGSFFKIRSVNLGYSFDKEALGPFSRARIYVTMNNPFKAFFSDYVDFGGIDPEPNGRGGVGRRLLIGEGTPMTRSFIFGVNFSL